MAKKSFEKSLERLEEIVHDLSAEKVDLDQSIKLYQEGVSLGAECLKKIKSVEKEVQQLIEKKGELTTEAFAEEE